MLGWVSGLDKEGFAAGNPWRSEQCPFFCTHWNTPSSSFKAEHFYRGLKSSSGQQLQDYLFNLHSWQNWLQENEITLQILFNSTSRLSPAMANKWNSLLAVRGFMCWTENTLWEMLAPDVSWIWEERANLNLLGDLRVSRAPLHQPHQFPCSWRSPVFVALIEGHNQTNLSWQPIKTTEFIW